MWKQSDSVISSNLSNNHSVLLGILFVFITLYLTAATLARNFEFYINEGLKTYENYWLIDNNNNNDDDDGIVMTVTTHLNNASDVEGENYKKLVVKMMEEEDTNLNSMSYNQHNGMVCNASELFTSWHLGNVRESTVAPKSNTSTASKSIVNGKFLFKRTLAKSGKKIKNRKNHSTYNGHNNNSKRNKKSNGNGNSELTKSKRNAIIKNRQQQKQQQQQAKKITSTEPIIYLFALVLIYLLLKAASDINQHYKTQIKDGKRLRRCSLQSYASQTHKQERRASKGIFKNMPKL